MIKKSPTVWRKLLYQSSFSRSLATVVANRSTIGRETALPTKNHYTHLNILLKEKRMLSGDSNSKLPPNDQPHGTATITFDEKEEETLANQTKHPEESLEGDRESYSVEILVKMPDMGEGDDNKIEAWYKKEGDIIKRNDILCDIATPDFTFGMVTEDECDAIMGEIHVPAGEIARDHEPICTIYHQAQPGTDEDSKEPKQ